MDRTVPKTGSEEIELYMRTYYSLLRSTDAIQIETLVESHIAIESSLHVKSAYPDPDISAFLYSMLRLPPCMLDVNLVLVGQIEQAFVKAGYGAVGDWERVYAPGRRRRTHFDGDSRLAVFIASRSDIDDLVPMLTAYQIEWNKLHWLLQDADTLEILNHLATQTQRMSDEDAEKLAVALDIESQDLRRIEIIWQQDFAPNLLKIAQQRKQIALRLISGSLSDYRRATAYWWRQLNEPMAAAGLDLEQRPVYFVSSNMHSLVNLLTGFAQRQEEELVNYIKASNYETLLAEYEDIQRCQPKSLENFLYYILGKYLSEGGKSAREKLVEEERRVGVHRIPIRYGFDVEAQVIELGKLRSRWFDTRLIDGTNYDDLEHSDALILNIDYPLGMAAYEILSRITERVGNLRGIYIMGKAATLNGRIGDVMIPNVIHDEHSKNTYLFNNCFAARDVSKYIFYGNVMDNQKAISAPGTFLQNPGYMSVFYREGYTDIEMEGGPYLSAVYEAFRPQRHPVNEIVTLYGVPFDIGVLHYASDTPMKKGHNLGVGSLNYAGVEPTYATAIAILRRILSQEQRLLREQPQLGEKQPV